MTTPRPRGRRPGPSTTRAEIVEAARTLFGEHGYEQTTLRRVAETAGVDVALVSRAYGDKDHLFRAAVAWPWDPLEIVPAVAAGPKRRAGHRIAELIVGTWEDPDQRAAILALLSSVPGNPVARTLLRDFVSTQVLIPFVRTCGFDQPELRGALVAAHSIGLCLTRYVLAIEPLASLDASTLVEITGAETQRILGTPLPAT